MNPAQNGGLGTPLATVPVHRAFVVELSQKQHKSSLQQDVGWSGRVDEKLAEGGSVRARWNNAHGNAQVELKAHIAIERLILEALVNHSRPAAMTAPQCNALPWLLLLTTALLCAAEDLAPRKLLAPPLQLPFQLLPRLGSKGDTGAAQAEKQQQSQRSVGVIKSNDKTEQQTKQQQSNQPKGLLPDLDLFTPKQVCPKAASTKQAEAHAEKQAARWQSCQHQTTASAAPLTSLPAALLSLLTHSLSPMPGHKGYHYHQQQQQGHPAQGVFEHQEQRQQQQQQEHSAYFLKEAWSRHLRHR
jgi:hypothetical protein